MTGVPEIARRFIDGVWQTGVAEDGGGGSQSFTTLAAQIDNAQILNLKASEVELIDAPGTGKAVWITEASAVLDQSNGVYANSSVSPDITAVNQGTKTFTVAGDYTGYFPPGAAVNVTGSTGNDGDYTVASSSFGGGNTAVVVVESIPDATVDGFLNTTTDAELDLGFADYWANIFTDWFDSPSDAIVYQRLMAAGGLGSGFYADLSSGAIYDLAQIENTPFCVGNIGATELAGGGVGNTLSVQIVYRIVDVAPFTG